LQAQFSIYDILLIVGITQGLITSILLLTSRKNVKSSRFLALGLIAFCFLSAKSLLLTLGLWELPYVRYFPNAAEIVIGPLLFFYVVYLLNPKFEWKKTHLLHFLPFFISQALAIYIYVYTLGTAVIVEKDVIASNLHFNLLKNIDEYVALIIFAVYIPLTYKLIRDYRNWLKNNISDSTYPDLSWLKNIFILSIILALCVLSSHILDLFFDLRNSTQIHWRTINLFIAFLIYYFGFVGYKQPQFDIKEDGSSRQRITDVEINSERENTIAGKLKVVLEEDKKYLNPTISIQNLSEDMGISQRELSSVINKVFQKNFRDLINDYRVREVKQNLEEGKFQHMSLLGIAFESGFNSEASFYRIFRKKTGMSPLAYQKQYTQN